MSRKPTVMSYDCDGTNYVTTIGECSCIQLLVTLLVYY